MRGAALCASFDAVFTAANRLANTAGPTIELSVRYRRPTRLETDTRFEGWVTGRDGRVTTAEGQVIQGGEVTVEASGHCGRLSRARVMGMGDRG